MKILLLAAALLSGVSAQEPRFSFSSWVVYWDKGASLEAFERYGRDFPEVSVFAWHFDRKGRLVSAGPQVEEALARIKALPGARRVLATAVNDVVDKEGETKVKDPEVVHELLSSKRKRKKHLKALLEIAEAADGIEMDYENLKAEDRDGYAGFLAELGARLHESSKTLSVVVQPKLSDAVKDGAGAIDWRAAAAAADSVVLMAYNLHYAGGTPGPASPPGWVSELADFALARIPASKLRVALPVHGFDWPAGGPGAQLQHAEALALAAERKAKVLREPETGTPHFSYKDANGVSREAWFQDERSLRVVLRVLAGAGIYRVALWRLGQGDPELWERAAKKER